MSTIWRKPDQIIQPWMFGDLFEKTTCLWLKGVSPLVPSITEKPAILPARYKFVGSDGKPRTFPSWLRSGDSVHNSKTFLGVARAMAEQWGG